MRVKFISTRGKNTLKLTLIFAFLIFFTGTTNIEAKSKSKKFKPGELTWGIQDSMVISYEAKNHMTRIDMGVEALHPKDKYHKTNYRPAKFAFFGYQFENGKLKYNIEKWGITGTYPVSMTELVEHICFLLPGEKTKKEKKYTYENKFYITNPSAVIAVNGYWETGDVEKDVNKPVKLKGTFTLKNAEKDKDDKYFPAKQTKLEEGLILTETVYNQEKGYIESVKVKFRYWFEWTEPKEDDKPKYNQNGRWEQFEIVKVNMIDVSVKTALKAKVTRAINMAIEALKRSQMANGSWNYGANHLSGSTSLAALALLSAGVPKDDPCINRAFEFLYKNPITNTYDAGLVCMAVEARGIPESEWKLANKIKMPDKFERELSEEDRKLLKTALKFLLENRSNKHPKTGIGLWDYPNENTKKGTRFDNSNSQYAVLGLYSAMRCGEEIDKKVYLDIANQFMKIQEPDGPNVSLMLPKDGSKTKPKYHKYAVKARGWGYTVTAKRNDYNLQQSTAYSYGSMTSAGITSMAIARAGLIHLDQLNNEMEIKIKNSLLCAMAFFQTYYDMTSNPRIGNRRSWYYYYMYGMERVGMLMQTEFIGEHEWYPEGAGILVMEQQADGNWSTSVPDTAFALLFLKRATLPVFTGK